MMGNFVCRICITYEYILIHTYIIANKCRLDDTIKMDFKELDWVLGSG
jgi:hypothetical protein